MKIESSKGKGRIKIAESTYPYYVLYAEKGRVYFLSPPVAENFVTRMFSAVPDREEREKQRDLGSKMRIEYVSEKNRIRIPNEILSNSGLCLEEEIQIIGDSRCFYVEKTK